MKLKSMMWICLVALLAISTYNVNAQSCCKKGETCYMMKDGKMYVCKGADVTEMKQPLEVAGKGRITTAGMVTNEKGETITLTNGQCVNEKGELMKSSCSPAKKSNTKPALPSSK